MRVVTACDEKYARFANALARSVQKNTGYECIVHHLNPPRVFGEPQRRAYCANARISIMGHYLMGTPEPVLWLDADTLVRADISVLEDSLFTYDTIAVHTPEFNQEENQWLISTVGIANTPRGRAFYEVWRNIYTLLTVDPTHELSIMSCQLAYVRALRACRWLVVDDLGYFWSDKNFQDKSAIWEGQGDRKFKDPAFLAELAKYGGAV